MPKGSRRARQHVEALRAADDEPVLRAPAGERVEAGHVVRDVAGAAAGRDYRCPGCDQALATGTAHVVAWPEGQADDRRHWHSPCWAARGRRGVRVQRSRDAPRYG